VSTATANGAAALAAALWLLALAEGEARAAERASLPASAADAPITVDGRLDEPAWANAARAELVQASPHPGEPTPYATSIRVLTLADRVWIGADCRDPEAARIAIHTLVRDRDMSGDDRISVALDTFGDGRSGYLFEVNAAGTRRDGLIAGPQQVSTDWDGVWRAAAARDAGGWSVEIEIPTRSLQFRQGAPSWGLNVERWVARERMSLLWSSPSLDSVVTDLARAGELTELGGLEQGLGLSLVPYALARGVNDRDRDRQGGEGDVGGEVYYNLTPQLLGVATVNTDFAETEVDDLVANLTRFDLFLPEKRGFFLEGSNLFEFGLGLSDLFLPFYSRRVGLFAGRPAPIAGGGKLLGRSGRAGVAMLDVQTQDAPQAPATNLFAGRFTWDASDHLRIGLIGTRGHPDGRSDNALAGADATWRTSTFRGDKNFAAGAWAAGSRSDPSVAGQRYGYGLEVDYPNDLWDASLSYTELGDALDPALGFLPRRGIRRYAVGTAFQPRPSGALGRYVRQFFFELFPWMVTDLDDRPESWRIFFAPVNVRLQSGDRFELNWAPQYERLDEPFEIADGVVISPGSYRFDRYRIEVQSSEARPLAAGFTWWLGTFYDGRLDQLETFANWTSPGGLVTMQATWNRYVGDLPAGDFDFTLATLRTDLALPHEATLSAIGQYETEERTLGLNVRFRWTVQPGSDLFLVWNRGWRGDVEDPDHGLTPRGDSVTAKLRWTFRR
jgi:hypothetical protein